MPWCTPESMDASLESWPSITTRIWRREEVRKPLVQGSLDAILFQLVKEFLMGDSVEGFGLGGGGGDFYLVKTLRLELFE